MSLSMILPVGAADAERRRRLRRMRSLAVSLLVFAALVYLLTLGLNRLRDSDVEALVADVLLPRLATEPISPIAGNLLSEILRDDAHHGLVDLALEEGHHWLVHNQETFSQVVGERAPWWAP